MNNQKEAILRFILDSSEEEQENLAIFVAGMKAQKYAYAMQNRKRGRPSISYTNQHTVPVMGGHNG